jgi:membrane-bound lytic murein transglycosylase D
LSSEKAASYLKDLYAAYGDWSLAIAAYNCGPGAVNKAIRRAGGDIKNPDFWSIYNYLSPETRGYVPMFIATNYVMNYHKEHNISSVLPTKPLVTDTIAISERIHFNQISSVLDIPVEELRILNPQFRADIIPGSAEHQYTLILPSQQIHAYIMSEDDIRNYEADKYARRLVAEPSETVSDAALTEIPAEVTDETEDDVAIVKEQAAKTTKTVSKTVMHKVAAGETIGDIANHYGVTAAQIKSWNSLRRSAVRTGQQLRIITDVEVANNQPAAEKKQQVAEKKSAATTNAPAIATTTTKAAKNEKTVEKKTSSKKTDETKSSKKKKAVEKPKTHEIKNGENLTTIANHYGVSVSELKKENGLNNDNIRAGSTLKIPSSATSKSTKSSSSKKSSSKKKSKKKK